MNNFLINCKSLRSRYYSEALTTNACSENSISEYHHCKACEYFKIEILSQLVAAYFMYDGKIPSQFNIKLSYTFSSGYLLNILNSMFSDLSLDNQVVSVSKVDNRSISDTISSYDIILAK